MHEEYPNSNALSIEPGYFFKFKKSNLKTKFQKKLMVWYSENTDKLTNQQKITILKGCEKAMGNVADKELWEVVSNCQRVILKETNYFELPKKSSVSKIKLLVTKNDGDNLAFVLP